MGAQNSAQQSFGELTKFETVIVKCEPDVNVCEPEPDIIYQDKDSVLKSCENSVLDPSKNIEELVEQSYPVNQISKLVHSCYKCRYSANTSLNVTKHMETMHQEERTLEPYKYKCDRCDFTSILYESLRLHKNAVHQGIYSCDLCDYKADCEANMRTHKQVKHQGVKNSCDFEESSPQYLEMHKKNVHPRNTCPCCFCEYKGTQAVKLWKHEAVNHLVGKYWCHKCNFVGKSHIALWRHRKIKKHTFQIGPSRTIESQPRFVKIRPKVTNNLVSVTAIDKQIDTQIDKQKVKQIDEPVFVNYEPNPVEDNFNLVEEGTEDDYSVKTEKFESDLVEQGTDDTCHLKTEMLEPHLVEEDSNDGYPVKTEVLEEDPLSLNGLVVPL